MCPGVTQGPVIAPGFIANVPEVLSLFNILNTSVRKNINIQNFTTIHTQSSLQIQAYACYFYLTERTTY